MRSVAGLGVDPDEFVMTASHQADLKITRSHGLSTAVIRRPHEFGDVGMGGEIETAHDWNFVVSSFLDLAEQAAKTI